jgi:hypothetical protein
MTVSEEYRVRASEFRAKAEREKDPLFSSMFWTVSRTYLRLARHHERDACTRLSYMSSPSIAEGPLTRRLRDLDLNRRREELSPPIAGDDPKSR